MKIYSGTWQMESAPLGEPSSLPPLAVDRHLADVIDVPPGLPEALTTHLQYGCDSPVLPYTLQEDYSRERRPQEHPTIVLENEILTATFLPGWGGRLWSLYHKPTARELLYTNAVFQPGNLAIRNAWFSGGVEWNMGIRGHSPFTCSPVFAQQGERPDGTPFLRMFEFERVRRTPWVIECSLPAGSAFLFVQVHLFNPHDETLPMYWWSNIAVPEDPGHRVLAPADHALTYAYQGGLEHAPFPHRNGTDASYPTHLALPADYFFDIPDGRRRWISSLDGAGAGLVQCSTARQQGRKMFVWGMGAGGRCWQRFLTAGDAPYVEIQAGLARTQYECLPMPPSSHWHWTEAYGRLDADPAVVHGADWAAATRHVSHRLEALLPAADLDARDAVSTRWPDSAADPLMHRGSGWGALEVLRLQHEGRTPTEVMALFPADGLGAAQSPWQCLLREGRFPDASPSPISYQAGAFWMHRLREALSDPAGNHALTWYHLGVLTWMGGDRPGAREAWEQSISCRPSAWAWYCLGVYERETTGPASAASPFQHAARLAPDVPAIAVACGTCLLDAEGAESALAFIDDQVTLRDHPRLQVLRCRCRLAQGALDEAESWLRTPPVLPDLREGEHVLTDLWQDLQTRRGTQCPAPPEIDYRMR